MLLGTGQRKIHYPLVFITSKSICRIKTFEITVAKLIWHNFICSQWLLFLAPCFPSLIEVICLSFCFSFDPYLYLSIFSIAYVKKRQRKLFFFVSLTITTATSLFKFKIRYWLLYNGIEYRDNEIVVYVRPELPNTSFSVGKELMVLLQIAPIPLAINFWDRFTNLSDCLNLFTWSTCFLPPSLQRKLPLQEWGSNNFFCTILDIKSVCCK